jgi:hypothetical protein
MANPAQEIKRGCLPMRCRFIDVAMWLYADVTMKEFSIKAVNLESDDSSYRTMKGASQAKSNSSNSVWAIIILPIILPSFHSRQT